MRKVESNLIAIEKDYGLALGVFKAIVLGRIIIWTDYFRANNRMDHFIGGLWWVYNTYPGWVEDIEVMEERCIRKCINELEDMGILFSYEVNAANGDHTKWYSVNYPALNEFMNLWANCGQPRHGNGGGRSVSYEKFIEEWGHIWESAQNASTEPAQNARSSSYSSNISVVGSPEPGEHQDDPDDEEDVPEENDGGNEDVVIVPKKEKKLSRRERRLKVLQNRLPADGTTFVPREGKQKIGIGDDSLPLVFGVIYEVFQKNAARWKVSDSQIQAVKDNVFTKNKSLYDSPMEMFVENPQAFKLFLEFLREKHFKALGLNITLGSVLDKIRGYDHANGYLNWMRNNNQVVPMPLRTAIQSVEEKVEETPGSVMRKLDMDFEWRDNK